MGSSKSLSVAAACALLLVACQDQRPSSLESASRGDAGLQTGLTLQLNVAGRDDVFACARGFSRAAVEADQVSAIKNAPNRCRGSEGGFVCSCRGDDAELYSYAFGCTAALFEACGVEAAPVDGSDDEAPFAVECEAVSAGREGRCAQQGSAYACACGGDADAPEPDADAEAPTPTACEQALFARCAQPCADGYGACEASDSGVLGEYACTCSTNAFMHQARASSCEEALQSACNLLHETDSFCTGYGGACVVVDADKPTELTCTCVDGSMEVVDFVPSSDDPALHACRDALESTCGLGTPPDNALCTLDDNGWHARCALGPDGDDTFSCECYEDGASEARVTTPSGITCDEATLRELCPELSN